jgi:hydrogenase expression/formation protein HypC
MCLAIPGQVVELLADGQAIVDFMGVKKQVAVDLIEGLEEGDYVIVHAGFAINKLDGKEARATLREFEKLLGAAEPLR